MFRLCKRFNLNLIQTKKTIFLSLKEERGSILFLVIFITTALLLLGAVFLQGSQQERSIAKGYTQKIKAHYIAEAGVEAALARLNEQPEYFLHNTGGMPVYVGTGPAEEYFTLEWLPPGHLYGYEHYHTLVVRGYYRSAPGERSAQAVIKIFIDIVEKENGEENDDAAETGIIIHGFYGY